MSSTAATNDARGTTGPAGTSRSAPLASAPRLDSQPPIASETLFAGATEVQIAHRGAVYRLRQTALGKLILTK